MSATVIDDGTVSVAIVSADADNNAVIGEGTAGRVRLSPTAVSADADDTHGMYTESKASKMSTGYLVGVDVVVGSGGE